MSHDPITSQKELYEFVEFHELQNRHSNINFLASINISTAESEIQNEEMEVWIFKDVYNRRGKVALSGSDLNPYEFPEEFFPDFQSMIHIDSRFLQIDGIHKLNPKIGKYSVEIYPIRKIKD